MINVNLIIFITNTNFYNSLNISKLDENLPSEESELCEIENQSSIYSPSYVISGIDIPIVIYNDNKFMLKGGFWNGRVEISQINSKQKIKYMYFFPMMMIQ